MVSRRSKLVPRPIARRVLTPGEWCGVARLDSCNVWWQYSVRAAR